MKFKDTIAFLVSLWTIGKYKYMNQNIRSNWALLVDMVLDYVSAYEYYRKFQESLNWWLLITLTEGYTNNTKILKLLEVIGE